MAVSPAGAAGTVNITVTSVGGTSAVSTSDGFTYVIAPIILNVSPNSGAVTGGTPVTITGTNLAGATAVMFGAAAASSFTPNNSTSITAVSPAGAVGTVNITVTTPGGTSTTSVDDYYIYVAAPIVTAISPGNGTANGGTLVTITGVNFDNVTAVSFGSTAATSFTVYSATSITAVSPSGDGTVDVTVATTSGNSAISQADRFAYLQPAFTVGVTVIAGSNGAVTVSATPINGFTGTVVITCGQLPVFVTCNFLQQSSTVDLSNGPATVQLTINTSSVNPAVMQFPHMRPGLERIAFGALFSPAVFLLFVRKRGRRVAGMLLFMFALVFATGLAGCGSGGTIPATPTSTPPGTYSISIQGTSGSIVGSTQLTLIVN
jgi:hypothetical protein